MEGVFLCSYAIGIILGLDQSKMQLSEILKG